LHICRNQSITHSYNIIGQCQQEELALLIAGCISVRIKKQAAAHLSRRWLQS
jgi:hypothetical protein